MEISIDSVRLIELAESGCRFRLSDDDRSFLSAVLIYQDIPTRAISEADIESSEETATLAPQQKISARLLVWLCTDADAVAQIPHWGIRVFNAQIEGLLNLQYAEIDFPLIFRQCLFTEAIRLECASLPSLDLSGSHLQGSQIIELTGNVTTAALIATNLQVEHHVFLMDGFEAAGVVGLSGAKIGGQLNCDGGKFRAATGYALFAQGAEIGEAVFLRNGFEAAGVVRLSGAKIGGQLNCDGGKFRAATGYALFAQGAEIGEAVFLRNGFEAAGVVRLSGAKIGGQLNCSGGKFCNPTRDALNADGAEIRESVFLGGGFQATGAVRLSGAKIGGQLACSGGTFCNPTRDALFAQGAEIRGSVFLDDGFEAVGAVWLQNDVPLGGGMMCASAAK
ncbi:hypothetical protein Lepto7375DRAFT_0639 [Leptolyngbya sp. PCC 7375]|nr:hypothetical protein Lepto7375DRAFT_0639 [Leptolyngbya sp. PCC 7375]